MFYVHPIFDSRLRRAIRELDECQYGSSTEVLPVNRENCFHLHPDCNVDLPRDLIRNIKNITVYNAHQDTESFITKRLKGEKQCREAAEKAMNVMKINKRHFPGIGPT